MKRPQDVGTRNSLKDVKNNNNKTRMKDVKNNNNEQ